VDARVSTTGAPAHRLPPVTAQAGGGPGDRPAPAPLEPFRLFLNSDDRYRGVDHLASRAGFRAYAEQVLPGWPASLSAEDLDRARALRDGLRSVVLLEAGGAAAVNAVATAHPVSAELALADGSVRSRLRPAGRGAFARLVALALDAAHTAAADGSLGLLRACERADCQWIYWSGGAAGASRWCSHTCSNVMKMRAYRERRRAAG
jgi:predicted RNA-binding Zn ribbon-like protein